LEFSGDADRPAIGWSCREALRLWRPCAL